MTRSSYLRIFKLLSIALSLAIAYTFALMNIRAYFAWYDDEGFMLMTLRQYTAGLSLYDKMYTEYGPFFYICQSAIFRVAGWPINHDSVRWFTVIELLIIAAGWGICVWAWSRSLFWGTTAMLATMVVMRLLNREPGHPQTLILILYTFAFMAVTAYKKLPDAFVFAAVGAASAAIML